ncbi:hypothetical protein ACJQWK_01611 [Exserohilum turcicum]
MLPPIAAWVDWWTQRNNCTAAIQQVTYNGVVRHVSWTCGGQDGIVQHYEVESLGHCWADTSINYSQLTVPQGPSVIRASEIVINFFDSM